MKRVLLYKNGLTDPALVPRIGDYEAWFGGVLGERARIEIHHGFERPRHPLTGYDAMILSGSARSLAEPEPWMDEAAAFVRHAADRGLPVLGVCFGHQLIGYAYGARVQQNPRGWEVGTCEIRLTEAGRRDRLFEGIPERFRANQSHRDEVSEIAASMTVLAENVHARYQAIAVGEHVRGVQFHPEMTAHVISGVVAHRRAILSEDVERLGRPAEDHPDRVLERVRETPDGARVLMNFLYHFVR